MLIIYLFVLHFLADFILQPREMGRRKSSDFGYLAVHVGIQIGVFLVGLWIVTGSFMFALIFAVLNGLIHGIVDAFIWKGYAASVWLRRKDRSMTVKELKVSWKYWDDHWFYVTIGLDQLLHMSTLVLVLMLLL